MITFTVIGTPVPQGSKKAFMAGGRPIIVETNDAKKKTWRGEIADAIERWKEARPETAPALPLTGPLAIDVTFYLRRPPSAPKRRQFPDVKPDGDKLLRSVCDAVTIAGLWGDDAQVCDYHVRKRYAPPGESTGVRVWIGTIGEWQL